MANTQSAKTGHCKRSLIESMVATGRKRDSKSCSRKATLSLPRITGRLQSYQLFSKIINARIQDVLLASQTNDQAGFRRGFCCDDHLFAITLIIEKMNEFHQPLWIAVVDVRKAFDTIEHGALRTAMFDKRGTSRLTKESRNLELKEAQSKAIQSAQASPTQPLRKR